MKDSKDPKSNGDKRVASNFGRKSSKRVKAADGGIAETPVEDPFENISYDNVESDSKNDPIGASILGGTISVVSVLNQRLQIVERFC